MSYSNRRILTANVLVELAELVEEKAKEEGFPRVGHFIGKVLAEEVGRPDLDKPPALGAGRKERA